MFAVAMLLAAVVAVPALPALMGATPAAAVGPTVATPNVATAPVAPSNPEPADQLEPAAAAPFNATSRPEISIRQLTPVTQSSGNTFQYTMAIACSNVNADPCAKGGTITIPLGKAAGFPFTVGSSPLVKSSVVRDGQLVIALADLAQGTSAQIGFTLQAPNKTTPNGTSWTLSPVMSFTDGTPSVTAPGVTSSATAKQQLRVTKRADSDFFTPGSIVTYELAFDCPIAGVGTGSENMRTLQLVDTLPAGLTFHSSAPAATVSGQRVTIDLTADEMGRCSSPTTPTGNSRAIIQAKVNWGVTDGTKIVNQATISGQTLSGTPLTTQDSTGITVVAQLPGGDGQKRGYGPVLNSIGDHKSQPSVAGYNSATYPGAWLGRGIAAKPMPNTLIDLKDMNAVHSAQIEAVYAIRVAMPSAGTQFSLVDPMPCATNATGTIVASKPVGQSLCTSPVFHPTMITVDVRDAIAGVGIPDAFVPQARLTNGTVVTLLPQGTHATVLPNGPSMRSYWVPESAVGKVAELIFPKAAGMTNGVTDIAIGGYADANRKAGDILRNAGEISSYRVGEAAPYAKTPTGTGSLYISGGAQIGLQKNHSSYYNGFQLSVESFLSGPVKSDLVFTDPLPEDWELNGDAIVDVWDYARKKNTTPFPGVSTVVTADPITGQKTVTVTVAKESINAHVAERGPGRYRFQAILPATTPFPGNFTNTARVRLADADVRDQCTQGTKVPGGAGITCESSTNFVVNPTATSDAVRVSKSVRGSADSAFKTFPAIGYVANQGGTATYRLSWKNKSYETLNGVVAYDLLPAIGDTGTVQSTRDQQRGSTFRPTLTKVGALPAGVTAFYSTAANPCRSEVLPAAQNPGCSNSWTAMPANPSAGVLNSIRALKFVSNASYTFDQGFDIDLSMSVPSLSKSSDVAWNTFASAQQNAQTSQKLPPAESARVGVARTDYSHVTFKKIVDKKSATNGDTLKYTVSVTNDGGRNIAAMKVTDTLPAGATFVSATGEGTHAQGVVSWDVRNLLLGETRTLTITATVSPSVAGGSNLVNRVGVSGTPATAENPCSDDASKSCAATTIPATGALSVGKTSTPASRTEVKSGDQITYSLKFAATGNVPQTVNHTDWAGGVLDDATVVAAPTVSPTGSLTVSPISGNKFTVTGSLAAGTTATVKYTVKVDAPVKGDGVLTNYLVKTGTNPPASCVPTDTLCTTHPVKQFSVQKSATALTADGAVTYTVRVVNTGSVAYTASAPAKFVDNMSDVLDDAVLVPGSITSTLLQTGKPDTPAKWVFSGPTGTPPVLTGSGALPVGAAVEARYTVKARADLANHTLKNSVAPGDATGVCVPSSAGGANTCVTVTDLPDLDVQKTVDPASGTEVRPGESLKYAVTFKNVGRADAAVDWTDDMTGVLDDAALVGPPVSSSGGLKVGFTKGDQSFRVQGKVEPGKSHTVTYEVTVNDPALGDGNLRNFVMPTGTQPPAECVPGENSAHCTENPITPVGSLAWNKVDLGGTTLAGSVWTIAKQPEPGAPSVLPTEVSDCVAESAALCLGPDTDPGAGKFRLTGLDYGEYELRETRAPVGFTLLRDPISVTIDSGSQQLEDIVNEQQAVPAIPLTGGFGTDAYLVLGGLLLLLTLGAGKWELSRRRQLAPSEK